MPDDVRERRITRKQLVSALIAIVLLSYVVLLVGGSFYGVRIVSSNVVVKGEPYFTSAPHETAFVDFILTSPSNQTLFGFSLDESPYPFGYAYSGGVSFSGQPYYTVPEGMELIELDISYNYTGSASGSIYGIGAPNFLLDPAPLSEWRPTTIVDNIGASAQPGFVELEYRGALLGHDTYTGGVTCGFFLEATNASRPASFELTVHAVLQNVGGLVPFIGTTYSGSASAHFTIETNGTLLSNAPALP